MNGLSRTVASGIFSSGVWEDEAAKGGARVGIARGRVPSMLNVWHRRVPSRRENM